MHIGVIAPPWFPIPPLGYGGIERVVFDLVESFVEAGERVTLFAPGGSRTSAELVTMLPRATGLDISERRRSHLLQWYGNRVQETAETLGLDIICDHTEASYDRGWKVPHVRIIHGPVTASSLARCRESLLNGEQLIGISQRQVELFEQAGRKQSECAETLRFTAAIHNPVDVEQTPFYPASSKEPYAAYIGRCHPEKGPVEAIEVAMRAGIPLRMGLRISNEERPYFETVVGPLINDAPGLVEYLGEVNGSQRDELFGRASVLIFSSTWEEPFGLAIIEALARGTPVIALARGSAPELVRHQVTGVLCEDFTEMAERLSEAMLLDPLTCRTDALQRFDRRHIAAKHLALMSSLLRRPYLTDTARNEMRGPVKPDGDPPRPTPIRTTPAAA